VVATTLAVAGAALVILQAAANTMLQISSPDHLRGRVMAVYALVLAGAPPLGALLAAGLAQTWGARGTFLTCGGVGLLAVSAAAWPRAAPADRCQPPGSRYAGGA
jgi:MFS family permease